MGRYLITTHHGIDGVALSKAGQWGGLRFPDYREAYDAAVADCGPTAPISVVTETIKARRK